MWFNNVETKPGIGYPKKWEDQDLHQGGWTRRGEKLCLRAGGATEKLLKIFHNPDLPEIVEYYEPWTYDYEKLTSSPARSRQPTARPKSMISDDPIEVAWGPNWEDDLAGVTATGAGDINFTDLDHRSYLQFNSVFMFYLPRLCEHCLNPACVASCPSGALYKRDEDGIVLVDQERCRGWRYCVSGCPYKKVYYNWKTGKSEKCIFCYPRIETGMPSLCAESCVGRLRYIGVVLYDADKIKDTASTKNPRDLLTAHINILLNPHDPNVMSEALDQGVPKNWIEAARASPVYKLVVEWKLALPPHPEFRTLPMVWYIPPLSPLISAAETDEGNGDAMSAMRIPLTYLANLLAAGDQAPVRRSLERLTAVREYMRSIRVEQDPDLAVLERAGITKTEAEAMYRLLAIAKYEDRFVIPAGRRSDSGNLHEIRGQCGLPPD
jgi:nitrate reductase beta subunit